MVSGTVQGVGFRPFIHRLAMRHGITGSVANTAAGVLIIADGPAPAVQRFIARFAQSRCRDLGAVGFA